LINRKLKKAINKGFPDIEFFSWLLSRRYSYQETLMVAVCGNIATALKGDRVELTRLLLDRLWR
jgi:hypothetical protein